MHIYRVFIRSEYYRQQKSRLFKPLKYLPIPTSLHTIRWNNSIWYLSLDCHWIEMQQKWSFTKASHWFVMEGRFFYSIAYVVWCWLMMGRKMRDYRSSSTYFIRVSKMSQNILDRSPLVPSPRRRRSCPLGFVVKKFNPSKFPKEVHWMSQLPLQNQKIHFPSRIQIVNFPVTFSMFRMSLQI